MSVQTGPLAPVSGRHRSRRWRRFAIAASISAIAAIIGWKWALPVIQFPQSTGRYDIGTVTYDWIDQSRPDIFSADPDQRRALVVQIWYPAISVADAPPAPYMADAHAVMTAFAARLGYPAVLFRQFAAATTHAQPSAPVADGQSAYPVLLFLEGAAGFRQMNMFQVEELVSQGYIVAAIDQPGTAASVVFSDGRRADGSSADELRGLIQPSYMPGKTAPPLHGRPFAATSIIPFLAQDVSFVIDRLAALDQSDPNSMLSGHLDLSHIGLFGVSLGGIVVGEACLRDRRIGACLMMDAPMTTDVVTTGLSQPSLWITRDAAMMRLERQSAGGWPEAEIAAHQTSMRAAFNGATGPAYLVQIDGAFHSNFTDVPNWSPLTEVLGVSGPIGGQRAHRIINAVSVAFFDHHLKGFAIASRLTGLAGVYPEVQIETHEPQRTGDGPLE